MIRLDYRTTITCVTVCRFRGLASSRVILSDEICYLIVWSPPKEATVTSSSPLASVSPTIGIEEAAAIKQRSRSVR